jgi:hypothetical protein
MVDDVRPAGAGECKEMTIVTINNQASTLNLAFKQFA